MASSKTKRDVTDVAKAEKKEKRRSDSDGVHKSKKDKKDKKSKKDKLVQALDEHLQASAAANDDEDEDDVPMKSAAAAADDSDAEEEAAAAGGVIKGAMVDFALPLASDKHQKKIYKAVKKAAKSHTLLRGVKEVNKALRKSPAKTPATAHSVPGIVVVAGDISPAEVVMHLPVACEEVNAPYIFITSRAELGAAAKTKRPTSVVMLLPEGRKGGKKAAESDKEADKEYAEAYAELVKLVQKEFAKQMKGRI